MIPMFSSYIAPIAYKFVERVLQSGFLSEGEVVKEFERDFEGVFGLPKNSFVSTNSGTSALHLALEVLGIRGEVLLPANTFVATGLAVLMAGCTPVFCDILTDGTIDPQDVWREITSNTGAVIGVDWAGKRCSEELEKVCDFRKVPLIIDAAQALGRRMETRVSAVCFSFQATKHLSTGDGGGVYFTDYVQAHTARKLRWFGIDKEGPVGLLGERKYELRRVGYKYHMNDYVAALGLGNLQNIKQRLMWYRQIAQIYIDNLRPAACVHLDTKDNAFWAFPIFVGDVEDFTKYCRAREIPCSNIHRGIDHNPVFGGLADLPKQRSWEQHITHLPVHTEISWSDALDICKKVNEYVS